MNTAQVTLYRDDVCIEEIAGSCAAPAPIQSALTSHIDLVSNVKYSMILLLWRVYGAALTTAAHVADVDAGLLCHSRWQSVLPRQESMHTVLLAL